MEYAQGGTLADMVAAHAQRQEPIAAALVLRWLEQTTGALSHLHASRVLHRDLKSQNVLLTLDQQIKLADFGVSRVMTATCQVAETYVGTPCYMAPEVIGSAPYAEPADVWGAPSHRPHGAPADPLPCTSRTAAAPPRWPRRLG